MTAAYRTKGPRWWQTLNDVEVLVIVVQIVLGVWLRHMLVAFALSVVLALVGLRRSVAAAAVVVAAAGVTLSNAAWRNVAPDRLGAFDGRACLMSDPAP